MYLLNVYFFFFFQAEDGIRDKLVTGVQTCALPISGRRTEPRVRKRTQRVHLTRVSLEPRGVGDRDDRDRAADDVADVTAVRIGAGAVAFAVRDIEGASVRRGGDGGGIPPDGDEAGDAQSLRAEA